MSKEFREYLIKIIDSDNNSQDRRDMEDIFWDYIDNLSNDELMELYNLYQEYYGDEDYIYRNTPWDINLQFITPWEALKDFEYFSPFDTYFVLLPQVRTTNDIPIEEVSVELFVAAMKDSLLDDPRMNIDFEKLYNDATKRSISQNNTESTN